MQYRKLVLEEPNMNVMITQEKDKSNNPFSSFFKPCSTLTWKFSLLLKTSENREKPWTRQVENFLCVLDALEMKLENFQHSTNKLEESPYVFFVNLYEKQKIKFALLFSNRFSIGLMFSNFFMERRYKNYELGGCGGIG